MADDDGQQVVEIVSHPTSELADGFHLLRLQELLFESLAALDLLAKLLVGAAQLGGTLDDSLLEFLIELAQAVFRSLLLTDVCVDFQYFHSPVVRPAACPAACDRHRCAVTGGMHQFA